VAKETGIARKKGLTRGEGFETKRKITGGTIGEERGAGYASKDFQGATLKYRKIKKVRNGNKKRGRDRRKQPIGPNRPGTLEHPDHKAPGKTERWRGKPKNV